MLGCGAHISRAEGGGEGFALQFAEVVELDGGGEGDEAVDEHIGNGRGQEPDQDEDGDLAQKDVAVAVEFVAFLSGQMQTELAEKHARDEEQDGREIAHRSRGIARGEIERQKDEVARLRVTEHASPRHIGVGVEKSPRKAQKNADFQPFKDGVDGKFFPIVLHGTDCTRPSERCQLFCRAGGRFSPARTVGRRIGRRSPSAGEH